MKRNMILRKTKNSWILSERLYFQQSSFFRRHNFNDHDEEIAKPADQKLKAYFFLLFRIKIMNVIAISIIINYYHRDFQSMKVNIEKTKIMSSAWTCFCIW